MAEPYVPSASEAARKAREMEDRINQAKGKPKRKRKKMYGASPELAPPGTSGQATGRLDMGDYTIARRARPRRSMEKRLDIDGSYS